MKFGARGKRKRRNGKGKTGRQATQLIHGLSEPRSDVLFLVRAYSLHRPTDRPTKKPMLIYRMNVKHKRRGGKSTEQTHNVLYRIVHHCTEANIHNITSNLQYTIATIIIKYRFHHFHDSLPHIKTLSHSHTYSQAHSDARYQTY